MPMLENEFNVDNMGAVNFYYQEIADKIGLKNEILRIWCEFSLLQWQRSKQVKIIYLLYRWLAAILFLAVLSCSLLDIGRSESEHYENHYAKWWIYLTHWGLLACTLQAWLAAWIVTQGMMVDRDDFGECIGKCWEECLINRFSCYLDRNPATGEN